MLVHSAIEAKIIAADSEKNWKALGCHEFEVLVMGTAIPRFQLVPASSSPSAALMYCCGGRGKPDWNGPREGTVAKEQLNSCSGDIKLCTGSYYQKLPCVNSIKGFHTES